MSLLSAQRRRNLWGATRLRDGSAIYWWAELAAILAFYVVYSAVRNANGNDAHQAYENALRLMDWQRTLGINHEESLQDWALHFRPLVIAANYFYSSLHFVVTIGAGVFLFRRYPDDYPVMRNTLAITTGVALVGFVFFPLMPPRLLGSMGGSFGFEDTLAQYPTFWSFNSGAMSRVSNQFAAMPSVHVAWALWCTLVFVPRVRLRALKILAIVYPLMTIAVIVLTANHYFLDALGGVLILTIGWAVAHVLTRAGRGEPAEREPMSVGAG